MRTTVDLPPAVHRRASELAQARHTSLSAVLADLTVRGLATLGDTATISRSPVTGLPTLTLGRPISSDDVADLLDDE